MRRISTGVQGRSVLGKYFSIDNVLSTLETNTDIRLEPSGSGKVISDADLRVSSGNSLEIVSNSSSNSVNLVAPSGMGSDFALTLPSTDGANGTVLSTDGSGNLSFINVAVELNNQAADTSTYYPTITTSTSGGITDLSVSSSKLSFQPSSGTLTVPNVNASVNGNITSSSVDINGGNIDNTVIGASGAANGTFSDLSANSITETSSIELKDNIKSITNSLDILTQLNPVEYIRKSTGEKEIGLIAEQVSNIAPLVVTSSSNGLGINYSRLSAYVIDAIKELQKEIVKLQEKDCGIIK